MPRNPSDSFPALPAPFPPSEPRRLPALPSGDAWRVGLTVLLSSLIVSAGIVYPLLLGVVLLFTFYVWAVGRVMRRPFLGFILAMWIFPWWPLLRTMIFYLGLTWLPLSPLRFWLEITALFVLAIVVIRATVQKTRLSLTTDDLPVLAILLVGGYGLLLTLVQHNYLGALYGLYCSFTSVACYILIRFVRPSKADLSAVLFSLFVSYVLIALISLAVYVHPTTFTARLFLLNMTDNFKGSPEEMVAWLSSSFFRMNSLLFDENAWGAFSGFVSLIGLTRLLGARRSPGLWFVTLLATTCLLLSMSRGAIGGWTIGILTLGFAYRGRRLRVALGGMIAILLIGTVVLQAREDRRVSFVMDRIADVSPKRNGLDPNRVIQWKTAWEVFRLNPSGIGLGLGGVAAGLSKAASPVVYDGWYFRLAVEQGIPGLILWPVGTIGLYVVLLRRAQRASDPALRALGFALCAEIVALSVNAVSGNAWDYYLTPGAFYIVAGTFMTVTEATSVSHERIA